MKMLTKKIIRRIKRLFHNIFYSQRTKLERVTNVFDYNMVIRNRRDPDKKVKLSNRFYGFNYNLKRYANYTGCINSAMEHGPNLDGEEGGEYMDKTTPALIVHSKQRREFLEEKKLGKPIFAVGTSIYYGESLFSEYDLKIVKEHLGKTLLIYPLHDIENFHYIQDVEIFIDFVKKIKEEHNFDTVLVSMYFVDIERGRHLRFEREGWTILSSGRRENYDFCDIMKTIITMADFAIFQAYTSAIGFCTYLGVPSMIYHQPFLFSEKGKDGLQTDMGVKDSTMAKFEKVFEKYEEKITKEKWDFCNYWFGFDDVWAAEDLKLLFDYLGKLNNKMPKEKLRRIANRKRYAPIKERIIESIDVI